MKNKPKLKRTFKELCGSESLEIFKVVSHENIELVHHWEADEFTGRAKPRTHRWSVCYKTSEGNEKSLEFETKQDAIDMISDLIKL